MSKYPIIFLGNGPVAAASLKSLATNRQFNVRAVITKHKPAHHKDSAPVEELARELNLPIHFASTKSELDQLLASGVIEDNLVGVVVDYGVIISKQSIDYFQYGIVNSHFSLLPEWRGADPITFAILSGQAKTGVSLMVIDEGLDTGKLITQKTLHIDEHETSPGLTDKLVALSNELLNEWLPKYLNGAVKLRQQPHPDRATHSRKLTKQDGLLDFNKSAEVLEREIRAFAGWPSSRTSLSLKNGRSIDIALIKAHIMSHKKLPAGVVETDGHMLMFGTSTNVLCIDILQPAGKKEMPIKAFLNGYGKLI